VVAQSARAAIPEQVRTAATPAVEFAGVRRAFGDVVALDGVDLGVRRHELLAVVGPSGGGKTTLLSLVAGLQEPTAGAVRVEGAADSRDRLARCALMPQKDLLLPWRNALDNAILPLENRGVPRREARERALPLLARLGLEPFAARPPSALSGGMRQRVAFVRTLLAGKDVLLLDEPFGALDALTRARMQEWLLEALRHEPRTTLLVTHDVEEALFLGDRVAVLSPRPGRIVAMFDVELPRRPTHRETVTDPAFVALREQVLEALE
jgi:NitT/TauT family transport system ATP-binding protein